MNLSEWTDIFSKRLQAHALTPIHLLKIREDSVRLSLLASLPRQLMCHKRQGLLICECRSCRISSLAVHPDYVMVIPEKKGAAIKIEQIRCLKDRLMTPPTMGLHYVVIIEPAENLNTFAVNALLKLLEEPPSYVFFLLLAKDNYSLPQTLCSRCEQWDLIEPSIMNHYIQDIVIEGIDFEMMIHDLSLLLNRTLSPSDVANRWVSLNLQHILLALYTIDAQFIYNVFLKKTTQIMTPSRMAISFSDLKPYHIFEHMTQIQKILSHLQKGYHLNVLLALENILYGYLRCSSDYFEYKRNI